MLNLYAYLYPHTTKPGHTLTHTHTHNHTHTNKRSHTHKQAFTHTKTNTHTHIPKPALTHTPHSLKHTYTHTHTNIQHSTHTLGASQSYNTLHSTYSTFGLLTVIHFFQGSVWNIPEGHLGHSLQLFVYL